MTTRRHDLAIIGSGAAGFAAAIAARRRGLDVVMVERDTVGGTCVNTGCVPSKALLAAARARQVAVDGRFPGIPREAGPVDRPALTADTDALVAAMRQEKYVTLAAEYGWRTLPGTARFVGEASAPVLYVTPADGGATPIEAEQYLVATGAVPWVPPIPGLRRGRYLTSATAMRLDRLPVSMVVLGGNAVGLELGQLFARLGARVTIVETLDRIAPAEEPEISAALEQVLAGEGLIMHAGTQVTTVHRDSSGYRLGAVAYGRPVELAADQLLVATGRRCATTGLGLDTVGVDVGDHGEILVDERLRTTNRRVWAAGDVTGAPQYVYVAAAQGGLVVDNAFDRAGHSVDYRHLPRVTFTSPALASVGLTEADARAAGQHCDSRVLPLAHVPRAVVDRDTRGLVKLVADTGTGRLVGAHVLADGAGEVIAAAGYALAAGMTVDQLARGWCPYLTMTEGLKLAAQAFTRDISTLSCCAT